MRVEIRPTRPHETFCEIVYEDLAEVAVVGDGVRQVIIEGPRDVFSMAGQLLAAATDLVHGGRRDGRHSDTVAVRPGEQAGS